MTSRNLHAHEESEQPSLTGLLMHLRTRWSYALFTAAVGSMAGAAYGWYRVTMAVAWMKERWSWVCGTGLHFPVYFWAIVGGLAGAFAGLLIRRIVVRQAQTSAAGSNSTTS